MMRRRRELTTGERSVAAMGGAMVSALVVTPLDVAKTRMQVATAEGTMFGTMTRIAYKEGVPALWTGTGVAMAHAVPTVGCYLLIYDGLKKQLDNSGFASSWTPLFCGIGARSIAVLLSAPLEQMRTRMQAAKQSTQLNGGSQFQAVWQSMAKELRAGGIMRLWGGLAPYFFR